MFDRGRTRAHRVVSFYGRLAIYRSNAKNIHLDAHLSSSVIVFSPALAVSRASTRHSLAAAKRVRQRTLTHGAGPTQYIKTSNRRVIYAEAYFSFRRRGIHNNIAHTRYRCSGFLNIGSAVDPQIRKVVLNKRGICRLSVTIRYCVKTAQHIREILSPPESPNILIFRHAPV